MTPRRFLGSWTPPSGNSADVYLDVLAHYQAVTFPEILRAVADATGHQTLGTV